MIRRCLQIALAISLLLTVTLPLGVASAEGSIYEVDTNHELTDEQAIAEFESNGSVTGDVPSLDMQLTLSDEAGPVGKSDWSTSSLGRVFLRVDYNEDIERTIRFYIPREYVQPSLKEGLKAMDKDVTVTLEPTSDRQYTAVTIDVDGPTDAVFALSVTRGAVADSRSGISELVSNATGITLPSLTTSNAEWHYFSSTELADNETDTIPSHGTTVQYDTDDSPDGTNWVPVRSCDSSDQPVCTFDRTSGNETVILTHTDDPPQVRWKRGQSVTGTIRTAINDAENSFSRLTEGISSWISGDNGSDG